MGTGKSYRGPSSPRSTCSRGYRTSTWIVSSRDYILVILFLILSILSFSIDIPKGFRLIEKDGIYLLLKYDTPVLVAENKDQLLDIIEHNSEIIKFWQNAPSVILEYQGPEDLKSDVLSIVQNLGVALGSGKKLQVKLKISDNYVLIETSYDSRQLNNYSSLSKLDDWKGSLEKFLRKLLNLQTSNNLPHIVFVKTFGNTVRYDSKTTKENFLIITNSKDIVLEILENQNWRELHFELKNPVDILELNYFNIEFQSNPNHAKLSIDGKYIGETPVTVKLKGGIHTLEMELFGYKPLKKNIYVANDQSLKYDLEKLEEGILKLKLNVQEATVTIDNNIYKIKNNELSLNLNPGSHSIKITAKSRKPFVGKFHVEPNEIKNLTVDLKGIIGAEDWSIFADTENVEDTFVVSDNELVLFLKDGSLICLDPIRKDLLWTLEGLKNVLDIHKYGKKYLVICKNSLWVIHDGQGSVILKLSNESFNTWDFKNLIFTTSSGMFYKLSERTFQPLWVRREYPLIKILAEDGLIFIFDVFRNIRCYNVRTMNLIWKKHLRDATMIYEQNERLYITAGDRLIILEGSTGEKIKEIDFSNSVIEKFLTLGDRVFIVMENCIKPLDDKECIEYGNNEGIYSDGNNIYLLNSEILKIYFLDGRQLNFRAVKLAENVKKAKVTNNGSIILTYDSGRIVKIFGKNGY